MSVQALQGRVACANTLTLTPLTELTQQSVSGIPSVCKWLGKSVISELLQCLLWNKAVW